MPTIEQASALYPHNDAVHGFDHVLRVYRLAEKLAEAAGADLEIVRAAALLHDVQGSHPNGGGRGSHHEASADEAAALLAAEGWNGERIARVQECIRAHRFRGSQRPASLEAQVLFDADKLDVLGAIGVARTIAYATQAGQPTYAAPSRRFLTSGEEEPGEPHSAYHEYLFKLRHVRDRLNTPAALALAEKRHAELVRFFEALADENELRDWP
ncbi:HD domain-containing protein, partial [bacterium]